jgi:hypothetical protein
MPVAGVAEEYKNKWMQIRTHLLKSLFYIKLLMYAFISGSALQASW